MLVPRPETELVVELCLARRTPMPRHVATSVPERRHCPRVGEGAPAWRIEATDRSGEALGIAAINRGRLGLHNVHLHQGDWCASLPGGPYDAILANPPYISPGDPALDDLRHEPHEALVAQDDGFADLFAIASGARSCFAAGGLLLLEHGGPGRAPGQRCRARLPGRAQPHDAPGTTA